MDSEAKMALYEKRMKDVKDDYERIAVMDETIAMFDGFMDDAIKNIAELAEVITQLKQSKQLLETNMAFEEIRKSGIMDGVAKAVKDYENGNIDQLDNVLKKIMK